MKKILTSIVIAIALSSCSVAKYSEITQFSDYSYFAKNNFEFFNSEIVTFGYTTIGRISVEATYGGESKSFSLMSVESIKDDKGVVIPQFAANYGMVQGSVYNIVPTDFRMMVKIMEEAKSKGADAVIGFSIDRRDMRAIATGLLIKKNK